MDCGFCSTSAIEGAAAPPSGNHAPGCGMAAAGAAHCDGDASADTEALPGSSILPVEFRRRMEVPFNFIRISIATTTRVRRCIPVRAGMLLPSERGVPADHPAVTHTSWTSAGSLRLLRARISSTSITRRGSNSTADGGIGGLGILNGM